LSCAIAGIKQAKMATIIKGNVMDLAVGIIIGAAFTAIVGSLVTDLINPIIGLILGGVNFSDLYVVLKGTVPDGAGLAAARDAGAAVFAYGSFITAIINFLIIAFVVFMLVKARRPRWPVRTGRAERHSGSCQEVIF
jgi:large conductance mechanosensitive channel